MRLWEARTQAASHRHRARRRSCSPPPARRARAHRPRARPARRAALLGKSHALGIGEESRAAALRRSMKTCPPGFLTTLISGGAGSRPSAASTRRCRPWSGACSGIRIDPCAQEAPALGDGRDVDLVGQGCRRGSGRARIHAGPASRSTGFLEVLPRVFGQSLPKLRWLCRTSWVSPGPQSTDVRFRGRESQMVESGDEPASHVALTEP